MHQLKKLRQERQLTQQEVGDGVGLAKTTIASYEKGYRNISVPVAMKLAKFFKVNWTIFFEQEVRETYDKIKA